MLLPFHNQLTYDGQCRNAQRRCLGAGMTRRLHDTSQRAQAQIGIHLLPGPPWSAQAVAPSEEEQLRFTCEERQELCDVRRKHFVALVQ